jgi:hypothetical protein
MWFYLIIASYKKCVTSRGYAFYMSYIVLLNSMAEYTEWTLYGHQIEGGLWGGTALLGVIYALAIISPEKVSCGVTQIQAPQGPAPPALTSSYRIKFLQQPTYFPSLNAVSHILHIKMSFYSINHVDT